MERFLCILISATLLLCFCGCSGNTSSEKVEVIYEEVDSGSNLTDNISSSNDDMSSSEESSSVEDNNNVLDTSNPDPIILPDDTHENIYYLNDSTTLDKIKLNGRTQKTSSGININHAASAIEFNMDSSSVMLEIYASSGLYYTVMVDGEITAHHQEIENYGTNYIFVRDLETGSHNIKFIRDSESRTNLVFTVVSVQLDDGSTLLAKDENKKVIEFLGDSLTSGYGNIIDNGVANPSDLKNQSATKAYPFLLANKLGYDYRIVSMSGIALGKREGYPSFPEFYNLESYHIDRTTQMYTSSSPEDVDIVVVNLGTNDIGAKMYDANNIESVNEYIQHFTNLITEIGYRKDVKIIFVTGVWHKEPIAAIKGAINKLKTLGYNNAYALELTEYKSGGGAHPSAKEHQAIADKLAQFVKDNGIA